MFYNSSVSFDESCAPGGEKMHNYHLYARILFSFSPFLAFLLIVHPGGGGFGYYFCIEAAVCDRCGMGLQIAFPLMTDVSVRKRFPPQNAPKTSINSS